MAWLHRLKARASASTNDGQRTDLFSKATDIALLGTTNFDVEHEFVQDALQQGDAISSLLQCSIAIQENQDLVSSSEHLRTCSLQAWRSLMFRIFPKLRDNILRDNAGLNHAILACWSSFQPADRASWQTVDAPNHHQWLHVASGKLPVHLDLLTAELLVNGLPLARLPSKYLVQFTSLCSQFLHSRSSRLMNLVCNFLLRRLIAIMSCTLACLERTCSWSRSAMTKSE